MIIDIFKTTDASIIYKRKNGYSLNEILKSKQSFEPLEDEMIALNHVVRVCYEEGLPFSLSQIKRVFNKIHNETCNGSKKLSWAFIKQWKGNRIVKFQFEEDEPSQKVSSRPIEFQKLSTYSTDNENTVQILNKLKIGGLK